MEWNAEAQMGHCPHNPHKNKRRMKSNNQMKAGLLLPLSLVLIELTKREERVKIFLLFDLLISKEGSWLVLVVVCFLDCGALAAAAAHNPHKRKREERDKTIH